MVIPFDVEEADGGGSVNRAREWRSCCLRALGYFDDGFDDATEFPPPRNDDMTLVARPHQQASFVSSKIVNLIPASSYDGDNNNNNNNSVTSSTFDPWMEAALQVHESIGRTRDWIRQTQLEYVSLLQGMMSNDDASLLESTVASFVATTATEIESLRQMVTDQASAEAASAAAGGHCGLLQHRRRQQQLEHRSGIVQVLMLDLQQNVSIPFQALQKQRRRLAVHVWQHPLECILWTGQGATLSSDRNDDPITDDPGLQFRPKRPAHRLQSNVWESYHPEHLKKRPRRPRTALLQRLDHERFANPDGRGAADTGGNDASGTRNDAPKGTAEAESSASASSASWFGRHKRPKASLTQPAKAAPHDVEPGLRRRRNRPAASTAAGAAAWEGTTASHDPTTPNGDDHQDYYESHRDVLERESAQLQLVAHSDLDAVQQMEAHMVSVTALLSQFATLVSDQATDVSTIYQATSDAKHNVDKGQENLLEAKARTEASRHYLASAIMLLSLLLLLFHWVRP